jgi:hypothetical protein
VAIEPQICVPCALGDRRAEHLATGALTTDQIHALTTSCVRHHHRTSAGLTTAQRCTASPLGTPIVLDLNGDGITTLNLAAGVNFDVLATGNKVNTGWVGGGDGLLALDRNGDGIINDGELFGSGTTLANGSKATNGYTALAELDTTATASSTARTARLQPARVGRWQRRRRQPGRRAEIADRPGHHQAEPDAKQNVSANNGNWVGITSTYETNDGKRTRRPTSGSRWVPAPAASAVGQQPVGRAVDLQRRSQPRPRTPRWICQARPARRCGPGQRHRQLRQQADRSVQPASTEETQRLKALLTGNHGAGILAAK